MASTKKGKGKSPKKAPKKAPRKGSGKVPPKNPEKGHLFDDPKNVKRTIYALFAVCGLTLGLDFFIDRHGDHPWEGLFGFYAVYGFVACVILVLAAKEMRKILMRGEDYYDD